MSLLTRACKVCTMRTRWCILIAMRSWVGVCSPARDTAASTAVPIIFPYRVLNWRLLQGLL